MANKYPVLLFFFLLVISSCNPVKEDRKQVSFLNDIEGKTFVAKSQVALLFENNTNELLNYELSFIHGEKSELIIESESNEEILELNWTVPLLACENLCGLSIIVESGNEILLDETYKFSINFAEESHILESKKYFPMDFNGRWIYERTGFGYSSDTATTIGEANLIIERTNAGIDLIDFYYEAFLSDLSETLFTSFMGERIYFDDYSLSFIRYKNANISIYDSTDIGLSLSSPLGLTFSKPGYRGIGFYTYLKEEGKLVFDGKEYDFRTYHSAHHVGGEYTFIKGVGLYKIWLGYDYEVHHTLKAATVNGVTYGDSTLINKFK